VAKGSGLGDQLFIDGYDLSGDIGSVDTLSAPSNPLDVTAINKSAMERLYGLFDGAITFNQFFNDAANQEHPVLKAKGSGADRVVSYFHGSAIGNMAAQLVAKQIDFNWTRSQDGALSGPTNCQGNGYGLEYGGPGGTLVAKDGQLTAGKRTDTAATNGASLDSGIVGGTALGLAAALHVFEFAGTSVTVAIQGSSDDGAGDAFAAVTGGAFTAVSAAPAAQRIVTSLTLAVERYLRVVTTGTFSNAVFAVSHTRYPVDD
jgi:hypothetical protein